MNIAYVYVLIASLLAIALPSTEFSFWYHQPERLECSSNKITILDKIPLTPNSNFVEQIARAAVAGKRGEKEIDWNENRESRKSNSNNKVKQNSNSNRYEDSDDDTGKHREEEFGLFRPTTWFSPRKGNKLMKKNYAEGEQQEVQRRNGKKIDSRNEHFFSFFQRFIDSSFIQKEQHDKHSAIGIFSRARETNNFSKSNLVNNATEIIDKVLKSTPRILAIANLLLAVTYLLHSAVAGLFLGNTQGTMAGNTDSVVMGEMGATTSNRIHRSGRERLGGYLLFKMLLISAVVAPDTLDLLILLCWYTLLSFLRSLAHLAGMTTAHDIAAGQSPRHGVLKLLLAVLLSNFTAAALCAALFHGADWGMVILLSCDCVLLALDVLSHLTKYWQQVLEDGHRNNVHKVEIRQLELYTQIRNFRQRNSSYGEDNRHATDGPNEDNNEDSTQNSHIINERTNEVGTMEQQQHTREISNSSIITQEQNRQEEELQEKSRHLDKYLELLESKHARRLYILDYLAFVFEIIGLFITIAHFLHIWSLHGVTFNLVDGVLALHLHTAISAVGKKIAERRHLNRISRDLEGFFQDASDLEMRRASAAGDVCCICLGTMSTGNVKKVGCGHLYHTSCLREVVERARSVETARCPLCRASIVDGKQLPSVQSNGLPMPPADIFVGVLGEVNNTLTPAANTNNNSNLTGNIGSNNEEVINSQDGEETDGERNTERVGNIGQNQQNARDRSLFRFSTEGFLPSWLPMPAFSFEIVRRPQLLEDGAPDEFGSDDNPNHNEGQTQHNPQDAGNLAGNHNQVQAQQSLWHRLLVLAGAIPMSAEEEAATITQLVDMFPQYERALLLRELRNRGSGILVVEAVISGALNDLERTGETQQSRITIESLPETLNQIQREEPNAITTQIQQISVDNSAAISAPSRSEIIRENQSQQNENDTENMAIIVRQNS